MLVKGTEQKGARDSRSKTLEQSHQELTDYLNRYRADPVLNEYISEPFISHDKFGTGEVRNHVQKHARRKAKIDHSPLKLAAIRENRVLRKGLDQIQA